MKKLKFIVYLILNIRSIYAKWLDMNCIYFSPDRIERIICRYFKTTKETIYSKKRNQKIMYPRQLIQYFMNKYTVLNDTQIGERTGGFDRITVYCNSKVIRNYIATNKFKRLQIAEIDELIK